MAKLYLVVTPIGNLNDISYRAVETLNKVDFIACENPNNSLKLLQNFNISKKLIQVNAVHEQEMSNNILNLLKEGNDVAFISDAGFPCISDPGSTLVKLCVENNIDVTTIGGNNAALNALIGSDIDTTRFTFIGFLSSKAGTLKNELENYKNRCETLIFYESSHRIVDTLNIMYQVFGERKVCVAKELTKMFETFIRFTLHENISLTNDQQKGEFVIVVEGNKNTDISYDALLEKVNELIKLGVSTKSACEFIAKENNISKNAFYKLIHK
jgi:16S rRNA (cytidine1402-2'-O)-methyltransferase